MSEYIIDEKGKWKVQGSCKMLIEPSEEYKQQQLLEQQAREEQELLDSLIPTTEEIQKAETELLVVEILTDGGLI